MRDRKELNKLIVKKLECIKIKDIEKYPRAVDLYDEIRHEYPQIITRERVRGLKSFIKIINSFNNINNLNGRYILKKFKYQN